MLSFYSLLLTKFRSSYYIPPYSTLRKSNMACPFVKLIARDPSLLKHASSLASKCPHLAKTGATPLEGLAKAGATFAPLPSSCSGQAACKSGCACVPSSSADARGELFVFSPQSVRANLTSAPHPHPSPHHPQHAMMLASVLM